MAVVLAGIVVLAVLAAWLAPRVLDWNRYRDTIAALASTGLGRPVRIEGPISLALLPQPVLTAAGVTVADAGDGASGMVGEMRLRVGLGALLGGHIEVRDLALHDARMQLPWPPRPGALQRPPAWLTALRAHVEDGTLLLGSLALTRLDGDLAVDPATGTISAAGTMEVLGRRWRADARLGRGGDDGVRTLDASLDGEGAAQGTGGTLSALIAADGSLSGRIGARGPDLSQLIPAPPVAWQAQGRLTAVDGLAVADDLDVDLAGSAAHGAVALRLLPAARLDAALTASRLDLDAWLPRLLHGGGFPIPFSLDLSAEAAPLLGGTVRQLRAGFELAADGALVRDAAATLPGEATLRLSGRVTAGRFQGEGRLDAPRLRDTLRWLQPAAPTLVAALPDGVLSRATISGQVSTGDGIVALDGLRGQLDGAALSGTMALRPGAHPAIAASLALDGPVLDPWVAGPPPATPTALAAALAGVPQRLSGFDAELVVNAAHPVLHGTALERASFDARSESGNIALRHLTVAGADLTLAASGSLGPGGHLTDGRLELATAHAAPLAAMLPPDWRQAAPLFHGPGQLRLSASGDPAALGMTVAAELADLRLQATGRADLGGRKWAGTVTLRHPGAPRLLASIGLPDPAAWLGDGSLSLVTTIDAGPGSLSLADATIAAGALRANGKLALDWRGAEPGLSGAIEAETLPLPLPYARSPDPFPTSSLRGWHGRLAIAAAHLLLGLSPALEAVHADATLAEGGLRLDQVTATLGGGALSGHAALDGALPPHAVLQGRLAGATLAGPLLEAPLDLVSGRVDATFDLAATGYSPAALLSTLSGTLSAHVTDGTLAGLDPAAAMAAIAAPGAVQAALAGGSAAFSKLDATATLRQGALTFQPLGIAGPWGTLAVTGTMDLPADAEDLGLALHPAKPGVPAIGLRVIGPVSGPRRSYELAELARWLAEK